MNGDGAYDGPNGSWDADAIIWSQTRVLYTGLPGFAVDGSGRRLLTRFYDQGAPPAPTPQAAPFVVHLGPPATSAAFGVFVTDILLNPLDPGASYSVAATTGAVEAKMHGPVLSFEQPPELFRLLYCDQPRFPATCHDGPLESGCRTSPCYLVPELGRCQTDGCSGFQYGRYGDVAVTCKELGADTVWVTAEVAGHAVSFGQPGQCLP